MQGTQQRATYLAYTGTRKSDLLVCNQYANKPISYMFHQANMRVNDVAQTTINGKTGQYSLLMAWTETVTAEIMRL